MTKKLQSTISLRALLFGGPQLQYVVKLSMEDCLQQLKSLQATGQLGQQHFEQMEINDQGRAIRWKLRLTNPNVPISGSFMLKAEQQVHLRIRLGPPIRQLYLQIGLVIGVILTWLIPGSLTAFGINSEVFNGWMSRPEGIALGIFSICIVVAILLWIALTIGKFPDGDVQRNLIQELSLRFPMSTTLQSNQTPPEIISSGWMQWFTEPELEYITQVPLEACVAQLRSIEATGMGVDYKVSPIEFNNLERVVGWSFWVYPERTFNYIPHRVRVMGQFSLHEDGRLHVQVQIGPPLRFSMVASLYLLAVFGCAISWIIYEQSRFMGDVPITIRIMSIILLLIVAMLALSAANGAPIGFVPPGTKSDILHHLKQRLVQENSA